MTAEKEIAVSVAVSYVLTAYQVAGDRFLLSAYLNTSPIHQHHMCYMVSVSYEAFVADETSAGICR